MNTRNAPTVLTLSWQRWLDDNLARGCTPASLVQEMCKSGFDQAAANAAVHARTLAPSASAQSASSNAYVYDTPRLPMQGSQIATHDRQVHVSMRLARPVVALFDNLMDPAECDQLIELARVKLKRSAIVDPITGEHKVIDNRSSYGTYFTLNENDFIARLDRRIADLMHWPLENGEGLQILHYPVGGEYRPHFDYFPPDDPGSASHLARGGQRVSTLVMYLNDVEEGGQTTFPSIHLAVTPKKGAATYFEYVNATGQLDALSLHAGEPVLRGEKWIATKWMRQQRYG